MYLFGRFKQEHVMSMTGRAIFTTTLTVLCVVCVVCAAGSAAAQGFPGGGRGRHREEQNDERHQSDDPSAAIGKRFEDMASAKPVLKDVKLDRAQKDSIARIEKLYQNRFLSYSIAVRHMFEEAKAEGTAPDVKQLEELRADARKLQDQEYAELRAEIAPDEQRTFDANVQRIRADEDREDGSSRSHPPE
jgi:hypothetical protein